MLVTHLSTRKMIMPFTTIEDMYYNTNFRISLVPNSAPEEDFSQSTNPLFQKIFEERFKPHLQEYLDYPILTETNINFIRNDYKTAVYALHGSTM